MKRKVPDNELNVQFVRNFAHVDGNWPSHVYLEGSLNRLERLANACYIDYTLRDVAKQPLVKIQDPHLSLSRPFVLRHHQIEPFITHLGDLLQSYQRVVVRLESKYMLLTNDNTTRRFLAIPVSDVRGKIQQIVHCVDEVLSLFAQPVYYKQPVFHISIASMPISPSNQDSLRKDVPEIVVTQVPNEERARTSGQDDVGSGSESEESQCDHSWLRNVNGIYAATAAKGASHVERAINAVPVSSTSAMGDLLAGYGTDDDDDSFVSPAADLTRTLHCAGQSATNSAHNPDTTDTTGATGTAPCKAALSTVYTFTAVVCKIGNRLFRLDLLPMEGGNEDTVRKFVEVQPARTNDGGDSSGRSGGGKDIILMRRQRVS